jgi:hypothetical protein
MLNFLIVYFFGICFPVCLKISFFYVYIREGWLKKKIYLTKPFLIFVDFISIFHLFTFFLSLISIIIYILFIIQIF